MKHLPFAGLFKLITFRRKRDAISMLIFAVTAYLVSIGRLSDTAFAAVVPIILAHLYLDHKEKAASQDKTQDDSLPPRAQL